MKNTIIKEIINVRQVVQVFVGEIDLFYSSWTEEIPFWDLWRIQRAHAAEKIDQMNNAFL